MSRLPFFSLRGLGPWQISLTYVLITVMFASALLAALLSQSMSATIGIGGGAGVALIVAGWRYSNRAVMAIGAFFPLLTTSIILAALCSSSRGTAYAQIPIRFEIVDSRTGLPIAGARVRIRDLVGYNWGASPPSAAIPHGEPGAESTTDNNGIAIVAYNFHAATRRTHFTFNATVHVRPDLYLTVLAPGYISSTSPLSSYTGGWYVDNSLDGSNLATVKMHLTK
ncbi:MAG: hypothetical protein K8T25_03025 [Planctomycetia bacterium]|nr:hypothetical protein [Planctomycetia bacterium]